MRRSYFGFLGSVTLAASALGNAAEDPRVPLSPVKPAPAFVPPQANPFKIVSRHPGDVAAEIEDGKAVLSIRNHGIGAASISRGDGEWPEDVVVRAYLRGMESFKITRGPLAWSASVQSHGEHLTVQTHPAEGKEEQPLKPGSPLFTEIRRLGADGAPVEGLPPAGGWFEFRIPRALLKADGELKLEWIDFYR